MVPKGAGWSLGSRVSTALTNTVLDSDSKGFSLPPAFSLWNLAGQSEENLCSYIMDLIFFGFFVLVRV